MIEVRAHQSLAELDPMAMEKVNASSANASLFSSPAWLGHFLTHDVDFRASQSRPLILAAWEGGVLKGYLPLKASHDRGGRVLSSLITQEVERPRVVAAPEDDQRVTHAFFRSLLNCSEEWDLLEFVQQDASSPLGVPPGLTGRHWVRRLPDRENNVTALPFADMPSYLGSLGKNQRHHKRKALKQILALPGLKVLSARHSPACTALFELFLDVENRSWKPRAKAGVGTREKTYRAALEDPRVETAACIVLHEGVPVAGSLWVHYGKRTYHLQTVYAESHEALSLGTLVTCVTIADALERKSAAFDMLPDFGYYKARWGAQVIQTQRVQVFRVGSARHLRAVAGDFWRKIDPRPRAVPGPALENAYKVAAGSATPPAAIDLARVEALLASARAAGAVEQDAATLAARKLFS